MIHIGFTAGIVAGALAVVGFNNRKKVVETAKKTIDTVVKNENKDEKKDS
jgi:uncharacterized protein (UPF0254 family)